MQRNKSFREVAYDLGFGDDLPDTPTSYTRTLKKKTLSEIEYGDISSEIEANMEKFMNKLGKIDEACLNINNLFDYDDDPDYELNEWKWDSDPKISAVAKKIDSSKYLKNVIDLLIEDKIYYTDKKGLFLEFISEEEKINKTLGCKMNKMKNAHIEWMGDMQWNYLDAYMFADDLYKSFKEDSVCKNVDLEEIKTIAPLSYNAIKQLKITEEAKTVIKKQLRETNRYKQCEKPSQVRLSNYSIVTDDPDLSYACNPWSDDNFSDELKERIREAEKRVVLDF